MIQLRSRHRGGRCNRGVVSVGVVIVLGLVGSCTSEGPKDRDDSQPVTDAEVLAEDPRFDGEPVTKDTAAEVCDKIAAKLNDTGQFSREVEATFDAEDDVRCRLSDVMVGDQQTSASAELSFYRLKKEELSQAANLLRDDMPHIVDCVMYRSSPPSFGLSTVILDSGPICDTPPDMNGSTSFAMSGFVANRTLIDVEVSTSRATSASDRFAVLGDPVPVRDLIVESTREILDSHPKKLDLPPNIPAVDAIQDFCTSVLDDTAADVEERESTPEVVEIWPNEQASKNVWCRTGKVDNADNSEVWTWVSVSIDVGYSDLEEFYNKANPEFYEETSYVCQLLQNTETHAKLSSSTVGESEAYSSCASKSDTDLGTVNYEERVVFIDNGLVVQAGSVGLKRNEAGEVIGSASEVTSVTHDVQKALTKFLGEGYTKLRA